MSKYNVYINYQTIVGVRRSHGVGREVIGKAFEKGPPSKACS